MRTVGIALLTACWTLSHCQTPGEWIFVVNFEAKAVQAAKVETTLHFQNVLTGLRSPRFLTKQPGVQKFYLLDQDQIGKTILVSLDLTGPKPKVSRNALPSGYYDFGRMCYGPNDRLFIASSKDGEVGWIHAFTVNGEVDSSVGGILGPYPNGGYQSIDSYNASEILIGGAGYGNLSNFLGTGTLAGGAGSTISFFPGPVSSRGAFPYQGHIFAFNDLGTVDVYKHEGGQWHVTFRLPIEPGFTSTYLRPGIGGFGYALDFAHNNQGYFSDLTVFDLAKTILASNSALYSESKRTDLVTLTAHFNFVAESFVIGTAPNGLTSGH